MTAIDIREATIDDINEILQLYRQPEMDNGSGLTLEKGKSLFEKIQRYPNYKFYVACQANIDSQEEIVGVFGLLIMDNIGHVGTPSGIVEGVCVRPGLQGLGIGKQMMVVAQHKCAEAGCYKMTLSSNLKRKKAHQFYEKLGFDQHGVSFQINIKNPTN